MKIVIPKETHPGETRVALIPEGVKSLVDKGIQVSIQKDAGLKANFLVWDIFNLQESWNLE